jgi:MFS transporter, UMF1 family
VSGPGSGRRRLTREQRGWCLYDWANSVFKVSVLAVFFSLYLTDVVQADAHASGQACPTSLRECAVDMFGLRVQAGSVFGFLLAAATVVQVVLLPMVGAVADRARRKRALLGGFAFAGAAATCGLGTLHGTSWRLAASLFAVALLCYYASVVVYYSMLPEITEPDRRDEVSTKGWAVGYLAGGLCLALNIALVRWHDLAGLSQPGAIRVCFVFCGLWWAAFTVPALRRLTDREPDATGAGEHAGGVLLSGFRQLGQTLREARRYPVTLAFLAGYLIFIDGINTVAASAGLYGTQELRLPVEVVTGTVLVVQFVAFGGGMAHGWLARRIGTKRTILYSLGFWIVIVSSAYLVRAGNPPQFFALALGIGLVLGGTPALSRSLYSQLVPRGREAEYFSLYTLGERGTSALGPLVFSVVADTTGSYRPAIVSLVAFLALGLVVTAAVPVRRGIRTAGNEEPELV